MELDIKLNLPCRYCGRKMAWVRTRSSHESRCPALLLIPNSIKIHRKTLSWLKMKLENGPITKGQGKALAKMIKQSLDER